jgi:hypothetical protein
MIDFIKRWFLALILALFLGFIAYNLIIDAKDCYSNGGIMIETISGYECISR